MCGNVCGYVREFRFHSLTHTFHTYTHKFIHKTLFLSHTHIFTHTCLLSAIEKVPISLFLQKRRSPLLDQNCYVRRERRCGRRRRGGGERRRERRGREEDCNVGVLSSLPGVEAAKRESERERVRESVDIMPPHIRSFFSLREAKCRRVKRGRGGRGERRGEGEKREEREILGERREEREERREEALS